MDYDEPDDKKFSEMVDKQFSEIVSNNFYEGYDTGAEASRELFAWISRFQKMAEDESLSPNQVSDARILVDYSLWAAQELKKSLEIQSAKGSAQGMEGVIETLEYDFLLDPATGKRHDLNANPALALMFEQQGAAKKLHAKYLQQLRSLEEEYEVICLSLPDDMKYRTRKALGSSQISRDSVLWRRLEASEEWIKSDLYIPKIYSEESACKVHEPKPSDVLKSPKKQGPPRNVSRAIRSALVQLGDREKQVPAVEVARWISDNCPRIKLPKSYLPSPSEPYSERYLLSIINRDKDIMQLFQVAVSKARIELAARLSS
jgi:hypothetical protein